MPPSLALIVWFVLLLALLCFDPAKQPQTSLALWVPLIWMFIVGSRLPSQWLGAQTGQAAQALEEGNTMDSIVYSVLILLAIGILVSRSFKWRDFFAGNLALMVFLSFALVSALWSDFFFIASKRWFRDLGMYLMILVALSDPRPLEAVRTLLRRLGYLLIPLCILLIKYYPYMSKNYDSWTGTAEYIGATTSKNTLGVLCLVSGLFFFWDTVTRWSERKERRTRRIILVNVAFFAMALWVLKLSSSATSSICLLLGCLVIATAHTRFSKRHPSFLKVLIPASFGLYIILAFCFDINATFAGAVGRDPTLTGRTFIWQTLLSMHTNPFLGTGYESFWLGPRLDWIWRRCGPIGEAHNGYLEVYLNLGIIGLSLLVVFLISSYRNICRMLAPFSSLGSLSLALWIVLLFRNMTEASFRGGLMWMTFLLGAIVVPRAASVRDVSPVGLSSSVLSARGPRNLMKISPREGTLPTPSGAGAVQSRATGRKKEEI